MGGDDGGSDRTRITRLFLPERTVIRKEPLGPDAERRVRHEVAMLERLLGVSGVAQLGGADRDRSRHPPGHPGRTRPGSGAEDARPPLADPRRPQVRADERLPEEVEVSAYYVVAEALTNVAKHSGASEVSVEVEVAGEVLRVAVRADGAGGVDLARGTGLVGLKDRVEALGGRIFLDSRRGAGTSLQAEFPLTAGWE